MTKATMSRLFEPLTVGDLTLPNRILMAPLTRCRAGRGRVPNAMMAEYYVQRASAGLIFSEATSVTSQGVGYPDTPGIWSAEQVEGWKRVTRAVHDAGGRMLLQLWHVGRISHPIFLDGAQPVAPSAIAATGHVRLLSKAEPYPVPRALELVEIPGIIAGTARGHRTPRKRGSMLSKSMARTAICSISSSRMEATSAPTTMAVPSKTAPG